jgi:hypothetical protein
MNQSLLENNILAQGLIKDWYKIMFYNPPYYIDKSLFYNITLHDEIEAILNDISFLRKEYDEVIVIAKSFWSLKISHLLEHKIINKVILLSPVFHLTDDNGTYSQYLHNQYWCIDHIGAIHFPYQNILWKHILTVYSINDQLIHWETIQLLSENNNSTIIQLQWNNHSIERENIDCYYEEIIRFLNI